MKKTTSVLKSRICRLSNIYKQNDLLDNMSHYSNKMLELRDELLEFTGSCIRVQYTDDYGHDHRIIGRILSINPCTNKIVVAGVIRSKRRLNKTFGPWKEVVLQETIDLKKASSYSIIDESRYSSVLSDILSPLLGDHKII